ncbi:MAG: iron-containing redox enzyme family protein [Anaerolineales bacterium]|jgi:pyrroloquinoline-quinone synthase
MSLKKKLDQSIGQWALLNSRFYTAWNAGKLPKSALAQYAAEYGSFIRLLPKGWDTLDDAETAEEEHEHAELWDVFARTLDAEVTAPTTPEVEDLIDTADRLFASPAAAMGAMYAFEAQQPETAATKLEGLRQYYPVPVEGEEYFKVHAVNHHESEKLLAGMAQLTGEEEAEALRACEQMSKALWDALDGIYDASMEEHQAAGD